MTIGEKIKKFRLKLNISQKLLATWCHMSEPAIRNYELGNRQPSEKQIQKIADSLGVSPFAISNPNLDSYDGIMHALFYLEDNYGLVPVKGENGYFLKFDAKNYPYNSMTKRIENWFEEKERTAPLSTDDEETVARKEKEYDLWRYNYPTSEAERQSKNRK